MGVKAIFGTVKGAFLLRGNDERSDWHLDGPIFKGWEVTAVARDARGRTYVGTTSYVYGAAIQVSDDLKTWRQIEHGPKFDKRKLNKIWRIVPAGDSVFAGVDEAGLFRSDDRGETWKPVEALNEHPSRGGWQPGNGGLCAHAVLADPKNPQRLWCGISAVGVFRSDDGGASWHPKNKGVQVILEDKNNPDIGFCVHALAMDDGVMYRREHLGMYRSRNGGDTWETIENGLPSKFGFPLVMDPRTKTLFTVPLESDEGRMPRDGKLMVFRSRNGGESWEPLLRGLPQDHAYMGVLRGAMAVDGLDPCGLYMGTSSGTVHVSRDLGEQWASAPWVLPRIMCVAAWPE
jgi:photosystem II stability/assembly factor-like uncharacterized protein